MRVLLNTVCCASQMPLVNLCDVWFVGFIGLPFNAMLYTLCNTMLCKNSWFYVPLAISDWLTSNMRTIKVLFLYIACYCGPLDTTFLHHATNPLNCYKVFWGECLYEGRHCKSKILRLENVHLTYICDLAICLCLCGSSRIAFLSFKVFLFSALFNLLH